MIQPAERSIKLPTFNAEGELMVVVETPKGSRNKYAYDEELGLFRLKAVLPEGTSFPYDFGMIPSTRGGDGDPMDILVIMDAPAFPGCLINARVIGAIEAEQKQAGGPWTRNDRVIGVALQARTHDHVASLSDLRPTMIEEIEAFFEHYNRLSGREFRPMRRCGSEVALELVRRSAAASGAG